MITSKRKICCELLLLVLTLSTYACGATAHSISVAPSAVTFGSQQTGSLTRQSVTITNSGTKTVQISSVSVSGSTAYTVSGWNGATTLGPSQQLVLSVYFQPSAASSYSATLIVNGTATADASVALSGTGTGGTSGGSVPPAPSSLAAAPANAQASLSWAASTGASSYNVKRSTSSGGPYATVASATTTGYSDSSLTNGTTYYYVVSAVNSMGESPNSNQASATPTASATAPSAPTGLQASAGNAQASLSWTASSGATSYNVKRATASGGPYSTVGTATTTGYSDSSLTNGTTYYYVVSAVNSTGESANSNQASATPAAPSGGVTISVTSYGALGNGVANDTAAINSAIAVLQSGYTLSFPCGTYLVSSALGPITVSNVSIVGASGCTTIKATGSGYHVLQVGTGNLSSQTTLGATAAELSTSFSATFGNIGGLSAGDYVVLQEGGMDYSTDSSPGHNTNCDVSGCRGEVLQVASVSGSTATVSTALHYTYDPVNNAANVKKLTAPVSGVTVSNLVIDGSGTVSNGLYMNGVVNSTVSNVTAQHFVDWGLLSYWSYNLGWNNVAVQSSGNGNSDAFQLWGQGKASINGLTISNLNSNAFGMGLSTVADSTFTNVSIDGTGTTSGRPLKLLAASYSTFNSLIVKNGGAGGYNGASLEYYSSHNTFNSCSVTNNSGTGILGFGNYNQYNKFVNCTVTGNTGWQLGEGASALGTYMDGYWEISGGTYTGASSNAVFQLDGFNNYVHNASINGPGEPGIYAYGNNNCINSNTFGGTFSPYAVYFGGSGNVANGNNFGSAAVFPNPLPSGTCP